jgi:hypothetical protein
MAGKNNFRTIKKGYMAKIGKYTVGRPIKYTYKQKLALLVALQEYIEKEEYPTMPKFCRLHTISKQRIYEWAKNNNENKDTRDKFPLGEFFYDCIKRMDDIQESFIEDHIMVGNIGAAFAIFKLKQLGWTDRQDITTDTTVHVDGHAKEKLHKLLEIEECSE